MVVVKIDDSNVATESRSTVIDRLWPRVVCTHIQITLDCTMLVSLASGIWQLYPRV